ncbi:MAG: serine/threonine-protein kinase [Verrucomicrobiota bacterium]
MPEPALKQVGDYQILRLIGRGAERHVFEALCLKEIDGLAAGERVALHCLRDREGKQFERQVEILASLDHPNILRYRHSFLTGDDVGDLYCLVTELLEGETLDARIGRGKGTEGLPWEAARDIILEVLEALVSAAKHGVAHCDLKLSNIYLTRQGGAKLIDFGIARRMPSGDETRSAAEFNGSYDYMAPDFATPPREGFGGDEASDIFSFGVCVYQILTGRLPWDRLGSEVAFHERWHSRKLPAIDYRLAAFRVRPGLRAFVTRCLDPSREKRFRSFEDVKSEFAQIKPLRVPPCRTGPPELADAYECVELLGVGGFGEVFRAQHVGEGRQERQVAIKRLVQGDYLERFEREARMLQELRHPNLVRYVDFHRIDTDTGCQYFLVLEYLDGMPRAGLRSRIRESRTGMDPNEVMRLFLAYLEGLDCLHQRSIIHRDIKPHNLYAPEGAPSLGKIFDLGIALDQEGTRTHGAIPGSWDYMPPELAVQGTERGTPQSDIYSLGVTLYQALTGELPFAAAKSWVELRERVESATPCGFRHDVFRRHPELVPLLEQAMAQEPAERYGTAREMRDRIQGILNQWETGGTTAVTMVPEEGSTLPDLSGPPPSPNPPPNAIPLPSEAGPVANAPRRLQGGRLAWAAGSVLLVVAVIAIASIAVRHMGGTKAAFQERLHKTLETINDLPPDEPLRQVLEASADSGALDRGLRRWWTNNPQTITISEPVISNRLFEAIQHTPAAPPPQDIERDLAGELRRRVREKSSDAEAVASLCSDWQALLREIDAASVRWGKSNPYMPASLQRQLIREWTDLLIQDPMSLAGLSGFQSSFAKAGAQMKRTLSRPEPPFDASKDKALDAELNAFKVWFGLLAPGPRILNPHGYQNYEIEGGYHITEGDQAVKLGRVSRPKYFKDAAENLRTRFQDRGLLSAAVRQDFEKLLSAIAKNHE